MSYLCQNYKLLLSYYLTDVFIKKHTFSNSHLIKKKQIYEIYFTVNSLVIKIRY